jgi:tetratricopeptide (TPR) repeat protein
MIETIILSAGAFFILWIIVKNIRARKKLRQEKLRDTMYETGNYAEYIRLMEGIPFRHQSDCQALAHANFEAGNIEQGRILFRKAFTMQGADIYSIRLNYGKCEYNKENFIEAIKLFQEIDS